MLFGKDPVELKPLITIIVAVFNGAKTLERCIDSVVRQSYPHKELIIMDGGSTDGSVEILKRHDARIKYWESKPDRGIYHAWNKALAHAEGEWVCFIGSDDFFIDFGVLEKVAPYLRQAGRDQIRYVYGRVAIFSNEFHEIISYANGPWPKMFKQYRRGKCLMHSGSFHHRQLFERHGYFDESLRVAGDFDLIWREIKDNAATFMDMVTICMGHGGVSMNLLSKETQLREALYVYRKNQIGVMPSALIAMLIKLKIYMLLRKLIGEKTAYRLGYCFSVLRGKSPIEHQKN